MPSSALASVSKYQLILHSLQSRQTGAICAAVKVRTGWSTSKHDCKDVDWGRYGQRQAPKGTMRECRGIDYRDARCGEPNSSEYRAGMLRIFFKSSAWLLTSARFFGAQKMCGSRPA